jgi:hypothetical protein
VYLRNDRRTLMMDGHDYTMAALLVSTTSTSTLSPLLELPSLPSSHFKHVRPNAALFGTRMLSVALTDCYREKVTGTEPIAADSGEQQGRPSIVRHVCRGRLHCTSQPPPLLCNSGERFLRTSSSVECCVVGYVSPPNMIVG